MSLKINPELQAVVAPLTTEEYAQLRDNIQKDGLLEPITLWAEESGTILDGHNRYAICQELGIGFRTKALSFLGIEAAKLWILEHQVGRRNLTDDQRAVIWNDIREQRAAVSRAAAVVKAREAKAAPGAVGDTLSPTKPRTIAAVVAESKIPERTLRKAQKLKKTNPDLYERVRSGTVTLREASKPKKNDKKFTEEDYFARIGTEAMKVGLDPKHENGIPCLGYLGWTAGSPVHKPVIAGTLTVTARETSMESYSAFTDEELVDWLIWADEDVKDVELTRKLAEAFTASLDASYFEYFAAACSGMSTQEAERQIAAIPEGERYLTRVLDSLDNVFADFDTETAKLDLPNMQNRKPEAIKRYLEFRLQQFKMLLDTVEDYVAEKYPATGGHS